MRNASDPRLKDAVNNLYRDKAKIGNGSSMDATRYEKATGNLLSPNGHAGKLMNRRTQLMKIMKDKNASTSDRKMVIEMLKDIQDALD